MTKTIVHVNRHFIAHNRKTGDNVPVYAIKHGRRTVYAQSVSIEGGTTTFVDPRCADPLPCGATIYAVIEGGTVALTDATSFSLIKKKENP